MREDDEAYDTPVSGPYRDGKVHVMADKCATCIYRPGNLMNLTPGRVKDLADAAVTAGSAITCHSTLPALTAEEGHEAICRGFYDAHGRNIMAMRLANLAGILVEDDPADKPHR